MRQLSYCMLSIIFLTQNMAIASNHEWKSYGGDLAGTKYSAANQINPENINKIQEVWSWDSTDNSLAGIDTHNEGEAQDPKAYYRTSLYESTPLMVNNYLYATTSLGQLAVIQPDTGEQKAFFDPKAYLNPEFHDQITNTIIKYPPNLGWVHRGASYYENKNKKLIILGTADARLVAINAEFKEKPGKTVELAKEWEVNLISDPIRNTTHNYAVTSPPGICNNTIILGASIKDLTMDQQAPRGDVRAYDALTGNELWTFHTIPNSADSDFIDSWLNDSWKTAGNTNVWTWYTVDKQSNTVYLATGTPNRDFIGVYRPGNNLYAESLVALDCTTGERKWHQQLVHHGLWDYDLPTPPVIVGDKVFQPTKQGFMYVFNKLTGEPIGELVETPVPASSIPGEQTSPTQPIPTFTEPFEAQGIDLDRDLLEYSWVDNVWKFYETLNGGKFDDGELFTPPSQNSVIQLPGYRGGASWAGATYNPNTKLLVVSSVTKPDATGVQILDNGYMIRKLGSVPQLDPYIFRPRPFYGRLTAYNTETGTIEWVIPLGVGPVKHLKKQIKKEYMQNGRSEVDATKISNLEVESMIDNSLSSPNVSKSAERGLGWADRGHMLSTPSLLVVGQESKSKLDPNNMVFVNEGETFPATVYYKSDLNPTIYFYNPKSGKLLHKIQTKYSINGSPITYVYKGKQYISFSVGGGNYPAKLVTFGL